MKPSIKRIRAAQTIAATWNNLPLFLLAVLLGMF